MVDGLDVVGVRHVGELIELMGGDATYTIPDTPVTDETTTDQSPTSHPNDCGDMNEVLGQEHAKWALQVAAAGGHNLIMTGPPGSGKTMLASRMPGIMCPLNEAEQLEVASIPAYEPQHRPALVNYPMFPALSGQIILDVESPTEILADKLLSYACASHLRRRDLWDMCWLASRGDVDSRRAMELAELKSSDYGEEGLWADRADRVAGVADVIGSDAFADEMRRFLPAGLMTSTVESPRWSAWAIEQIGTLYGTPGTPSSADAVPGFPIFGASNDSSPTR